MAITVANKYHKAEKRGAISVMRPSVLGNPYSHMEGTKAQYKVATREEAVAMFRPWLKAQMRTNGPVVEELKRLADIARSGDLILLCCCAPKSCHGDVIKDALTWMIENPEWTPKGVSR